MPIFEYICQECQHEFESLVFGRDQAKCPKCHSQKLSPQLSVFAVSSKGMPAERQRRPVGFQGRLRLLWRPSRSGRLLARRSRLASGACHRTAYLQSPNFRHSFVCD